MKITIIVILIVLFFLITSCTEYVERRDYCNNNTFRYDGEEHQDCCKTIGYHDCGVTLANCTSGSQYWCLTNMKVN